MCQITYRVNRMLYFHVTIVNRKYQIKLACFLIFEFVKFVELAARLLKNITCLGREFMLYEVLDKIFAGVNFDVNTRARVLLNAYLLSDMGVKFYAYYY